MTRLRTFQWLSLGLAIAVLTGCGSDLEAKQKSDDDRDKRPEVVVPVEVTSPFRGNISSYFETTARVEAERRADVAAEAGGRCVAILAEIGDRVEKGQILAELKADEARAALRQAEVAAEKARTQFERARAQLAEGHGTAVERDNARFTYEEAMATLEVRRVALENLTIRAPIDGILTERNLNVGGYVQSGAKAFSVVDPDSFMLAINPPEKELPRLEVGQRAIVRIDALRGRRFMATVRRIDPAVDGESGTVRVILDFKPEERAEIPHAAFARVDLEMETRQNVVLVPKDAVLEDNGRTVLFVIREADAEDLEQESGKEQGGEGLGRRAKAERVPIMLGLQDDKNVQAIGPITPEDEIVINGQYSLNDGAAVRVVRLDEALQQNADMDADTALAAAEAEKKKLEAERQQRGPRRGPPH